MVKGSKVHWIFNRIILTDKRHTWFSDKVGELSRPSTIYTSVFSVLVASLILSKADNGKKLLMYSQDVRF